MWTAQSGFGHNNGCTCTVSVIIHHIACLAFEGTRCGISAASVVISLLPTQEAEEKQRNVINKRMTAPKAFPRVALDLATTVERIQQNFVICDPNLPDCPIVFASDGFIELTEYPRHEILGRNCRYVSLLACFRP